MESCERAPKAPIRPALDGRSVDDWADAGCIGLSGGRGAIANRNPFTHLRYGTDRDGFYLRFEFREPNPTDTELAGDLHLLWFYPGVTMHNSPAPLAGLPSTAPLNYLFHHHLGIHLADLSCWLEEAGERYEWHRRDCHAQIACQDCLDIGVPRRNFAAYADYPLRLVAVLAEAGQFHSYLPERQLLSLNVQ